MTSNISKEDIFNELKTILVDDLEIPEAEIKESSNLFTDLDLDSIDAVDIAVRMQRYTDKKLPPEEFKKIQTIDDVVNAVWNLMNSNEKKKIFAYYIFNLHDVYCYLYFLLYKMGFCEVLSCFG